MNIQHTLMRYGTRVVSAVRRPASRLASYLAAHMWLVVALAGVFGFALRYVVAR